MRINKTETAKLIKVNFQIYSSNTMLRHIPSGGQLRMTKSGVDSWFLGVMDNKGNVEPIASGKFKELLEMSRSF